MLRKLSLLLLVSVITVFTVTLHSDTELDEHRRQVDGLLHRLRLRIERPRREWQLTDSQQMKYRLKRNELSTFLYDDNWKIGIVSMQEAPFFLSRAQALEKAGFYLEAVEIYSSLSILNHFKSSESNQTLSLTAMKRLERLSEKVPNSPDPVLFIDNGVLNIVSQLSRFHLQLPNEGNSFRLIREPTLLMKDGRIEQVLKIATGKKRILIFFDIFASTERLSLGGYTEYSDMKRGFDRSRKMTTDFRRNCNNMSCSVSFNEKGQYNGWLEIAAVSGQTGLMVTVTPTGEESIRYIDSMKLSLRM